MFCAWTLNQEFNASLNNVGVEEAEGNSSQFAFAQDNNLCDQAFVALFQKGFMTFSLVGTNSGAGNLFLFGLDPFFPPSDDMGLEFGFGCRFDAIETFSTKIYVIIQIVNFSS